MHNISIRCYNYIHEIPNQIKKQKMPSLRYNDVAQNKNENGEVIVYLTPQLYRSDKGKIILQNVHKFNKILFPPGKRFIYYHEFHF